MVNIRLQKEMAMLANSPSPGISILTYLDMHDITAIITGPETSVYEEGQFVVSIKIPIKYPFEPPVVRFVTPIYHPNIDSDGRICLDTLKMPPQGCWSPSVNLGTLLLSIRLLMAHPNVEDGLVPEITNEFKRDNKLWEQKAAEYTGKYAVQKYIGNEENLLNEKKVLIGTNESISDNTCDEALIIQLVDEKVHRVLKRKNQDIEEFFTSVKK
eukprot:gene11451-15342_t